MDGPRRYTDPPFRHASPATLRSCLAVIETGMCPFYEADTTSPEEHWCAAAIASGLSILTGGPVIAIIKPDGFEFQAHDDDA